MIRSNSKEHGSFIKSAEKKTKYGISASKFSSYKDIRGDSQMGSGVNLPFNRLPSMKDYKDNCFGLSRKESMYQSKIETPRNLETDGRVDYGNGGCFCEKEKCRIF